MATVTGPLHSQSASGQLGKALIYQPSRGQHVVRAYGQPDWTAHPATADQLAVQAFTKLIMEHWLEITEPNRASWTTLAEEKRISRINAYCIENWRRHRGDEPLLDGWPDVYSTLTALIVSAGDPAPDPDCTGDYQRIADNDGLLAFKRIAGDPYYLYFDEPSQGYCLDAVLATGWNEAGWNNTSDLPTSPLYPNFAMGVALPAYP